jgi:hypothetical protein
VLLILKLAAPVGPQLSKYAQLQIIAQTLLKAQDHAWQHAQQEISQIAFVEHHLK